MKVTMFIALYGVVSVFYAHPRERAVTSVLLGWMWFSGGVFSVFLFYLFQSILSISQKSEMDLLA
jgi:hypothetical protein